MILREFKNYDRPNTQLGIQIIIPCSQWLARCPVTRQRYSAAPAPKLSGTEKLLPCHRRTPRIYYYYF